ncbi:pMT family glycosyltransferase 4-amino-4-deoxy-L-arabinose transferase [Firmicutes bacterium CAG:822]|nr:pMT family glycosyltransferase 4-amino-4-deoxy-L-arabinose transferase [Firmicutes bacterium CAG:822]
MKKKYSNILTILCLLFITFLICMLSPLDIFTFNAAPWIDSSVFKYIGWQMAEGSIPYLDMFDHKGLLIYFINYIGYIISPHRGVWFIEFIFMFVTVLFAYKIAHKFVSKPISMLVVLIALAPIYSYFEGGNFTEEYALPFQMIALYIFIDFFKNSYKYMSRGDNYKSKVNFKFFNILVFINGICMGCVLFLRPNMISIWIVFCLMVLIYCILKKYYLELFKFFISFFAGLLFVIMPMITYLALNNAIKPFVDDYILFNMMYATDKEITYIMNVFSEFFTTPIIIFSFVIVGTKIYLQIKNKENCYFNVGYLIYMILTVILVSMSGRMYNHYAMTLLPMLIYPISLLFDYLKEIKLNSGFMTILTVILITIFVAPTWSKLLFNSIVDIFDKEKPYSNRTIEYIKANTDEDDTISVWGNSNSIYNFTNRKSASKYSYQFSIITLSEKIEKEYFDDLKKNKPKIIVDGQSLEEYPDLAKKWPKFLKENNYELVFEDTYTVYKRKN